MSRYDFKDKNQADELVRIFLKPSPVKLQHCQHSRKAESIFLYQIVLYIFYMCVT